jgi:hypothetical protein
MYAMSWERNPSEYKYESIQDSYVVNEYFDDEADEISLDVLLEKEIDAEFDALLESGEMF